MNEDQETQQAKAKIQLMVWYSAFIAVVIVSILVIMLAPRQAVPCYSQGQAVSCYTLGQ